MSTPLKPHWHQPSHPEIQDVHISTNGFLSKSLSRVNLPPFALYAKMSWPPCTEAAEPTYATVQFAKDRHLNLNSDLLYINHSCEPSLIFNTGTFEILVGPNGLKVGQELTFFYPSTEWYMAQPFDCLCGTASCRGRIAGARDMTQKQLEGLFLNGHIHALLEERDAKIVGKQLPANHPPAVSCHDTGSETQNGRFQNGHAINGRATGILGGNVCKLRSGPTSRELSGEMGGDTTQIYLLKCLLNFFKDSSNGTLAQFNLSKEFMCF